MALFSLGIPYRGSGALASPDPTNQLPNSHLGQATRPPGGSTAPLQLSKSSTRHPRLQAMPVQSGIISVQPDENINRPTRLQARRPVESLPFLWESPNSLPRNQPQVGQPVDEELHGQSHKQQAHDAHQDAYPRF